MDNLVEKITSSKDKESYSFTYLFTKIREWIDVAVYETGKQFEYIIKNKKWQAGFEVDVDTIEDLKADTILSGDLNLSIKGIADDFVQHKEELCDDALVANGNAFDNTAFFSDSRANITDGANLDNIVSGGGVTIALIAADIKYAMAQLDAMKIKGKAINRGAEYVCIVPTDLWSIFNQLATVDIYYDGATAVSNDLKGTFKIVKNYCQALTNNDWYMVNPKSKMKPLIVQERETPTMKETLDDDKDIQKYNWKARYAVGYGSPFSIIWVNNS
jgi:phage major head subunit gpT-like protein